MLVITTAVVGSSARKGWVVWNSEEVGCEMGEQSAGEAEAAVLVSCWGGSEDRQRQRQRVELLRERCDCVGAGGMGSLGRGDGV